VIVNLYAPPEQGACAWNDTVEPGTAGSGNSEVVKGDLLLHKQFARPLAS
jgi:hypothetical protein